VKQVRSESFWQSCYCDSVLACTTLVILGLGLLMVASASMVISDQQFGHPMHFLYHQIAYFFAGLVAAIIVFRLPISFWKQLNVPLLLVSVILLVAVLIPGIGRQVNGSMRWLGLGPLTLQVSELAKFSVILYLAGYLVRRETEVRSHLSGFIKPMLLLSMVAVLLLMEPDFGATTVMMATALGMMFLAGVRLWQFIALMGTVTIMLAGLALTSPYRLARLTAFMHPWANAFDTGYQLTQSLIAFGRGGIFGVGLGNSVQKLFYLPEAHTDFLFAVIAEELGLIGELAILFLFVLLVARMLFIGRDAYQRQRFFEAYVCFGFALWFGLQAMINIGVSTGLLPTKGLTLPLMSYGGSSLVINCIAIAVVLRIGHEIKEAPLPASRRVKRRLLLRRSVA